MALALVARLPFGYSGRRAEMRGYVSRETV
jgi:hypothetical protein